MFSNAYKSFLTFFVSALGLIVCAFAFYFFMLTTAHSQINSRNYTIVVPFAAGNTVDIMARIYGDQFKNEQELSVVVLNKPGASGLIAADYMSKIGDETHLLFAPSSTIFRLDSTTKPEVYKSLTFKKDFTVLDVVSETPLVLVTKKDKYKNFDDFSKKIKTIDYVKIGVLTIGSPTHLAALEVGDLLKIKVSPILYTNQSQVIIDTANDLLDYSFAPLASALPLIEDNKVDALIIYSEEKSILLPNVEVSGKYNIEPTIPFLNWIVVNSSMSDTAKSKIKSITHKIKQNNDVQSKIIQTGSKIYKNMSDDELRNFINTSILKYNAIVERHGLVIQ